MNAEAQTPANPLRACINAPGGISVNEAVSRAALHLELLRDDALAIMAENIAALAAMVACGAPTPEQRKQLHELSNTLAALGGMFQRDGLSKAAYSLCRLLDLSAPKWDSAAIAVHVSAMRLLFTPAQAPAELEEKLLDGLVNVCKCAAALTPKPE